MWGSWSVLVLAKGGHSLYTYSTANIQSQSCLLNTQNTCLLWFFHALVQYFAHFMLLLIDAISTLDFVIKRIHLLERTRPTENGFDNGLLGTDFSCFSVCQCQSHGLKHFISMFSKYLPSTLPSTHLWNTKSVFLKLLNFYFFSYPCVAQ